MQRYGRGWQTGRQKRSDREFRCACELVRNGRIGKIRKVEVGLPTGGGTDVKPITEVPEGLDWNFWLEPAPSVPYRGVVHWNWRWMMDYSGGQLTDWAGHHIDIAHWGMGWDTTGPVEIQGQRQDCPGQSQADIGTWSRRVLGEEGSGQRSRAGESQCDAGAGGSP